MDDLAGIAAILRAHGALRMREIIALAYAARWSPEWAGWYWHPGQSLAKYLAADPRFRYDREMKRWRAVAEEADHA